MLETAEEAGAQGATVTKLVVSSGLHHNDGLQIVRWMIRDGSLIRLKNGRLKLGLPVTFMATRLG